MKNHDRVRLDASHAVRAGHLDVGKPEYAGEARWRAWGGCWSCRRRAPDGSPAIPCGCSSPSAPVRGQLDPWEATPAIWARQALRLDPPIDGAAAPAAPPRDPEMVHPGSLREDGTQTGYPYGVQVSPENERRPDPLALELAGCWVEQEAAEVEQQAAEVEQQVVRLQVAAPSGAPPAELLDSQDAQVADPWWCEVCGTCVYKTFLQRAQAGWRWWCDTCADVRTWHTCGPQVWRAGKCSCRKCQVRNALAESHRVKNPPVRRCAGVLTLDQAALLADTTPAELRAQLAMAGWLRCTANPCAWCGAMTFAVAGVAWRSCPQACAVVKGRARELHRELFLQ